MCFLVTKPIFGKLRMQYFKNVIINFLWWWQFFDFPKAYKKIIANYEKFTYAFLTHCLQSNHYNSKNNYFALLLLSKINLITAKKESDYENNIIVI